MAEKNSFVFYRSFYEAASALPPEDRLKLFDAIAEYALNQTEIELSPLARGMFCLIKPLLEANHRRFANGKKGGRPKTETKPKPNLSQTEVKPYNYNTNTNYNKNIISIPPEELSFEFEVMAKNLGLEFDEVKTEYKLFRNNYTAKENNQITNYKPLWESWCINYKGKYGTKNKSTNGQNYRKQSITEAVNATAERIKRGEI